MCVCMCVRVKGEREKLDKKKKSTEHEHEREGRSADLSGARDGGVLRHGKPHLGRHGHDLRRRAYRVEAAQRVRLSVVVLYDLQGFQGTRHTHT